MLFGRCLVLLDRGFGEACLLAVVLLLWGCGGDECATGETQCDGAIALRCGPVGEGDDSNQWYRTTCRSAELCVVPPNGEAFCVVEPEPHALCPEGGFGLVCAEGAIARCKYGWVTQRRTCLSCSGSDPSTRCAGGLGAECASSNECAPGLMCIGSVPNVDPAVTGATCSVPCDCPAKTSCPACDAFATIADVDFGNECVEGICVVSTQPL